VKYEPYRTRGLQNIMYTRHKLNSESELKRCKEIGNSFSHCPD